MAERVNCDAATSPVPFGDIQADRLNWGAGQEMDEDRDMNMKPKRLVLIGGGQMGRALMSGILSSSILEPSQVCFVDPSEETQQWWGEHYPENGL